MTRRLVVTAILSLVLGSLQAGAQLPHFNPGDVLRADQLNAMVDRVNAQPGTLTVDCAAMQTIGQALQQAHPGDTIQVTGTCREAVRITTDDLTLDGQGITTIDGAGQTAVTIDGARRVTIRGLTVQGGISGLFARSGAAVILQGVTAADNTQDGLVIDIRSFASITDCTVQRSGRDGVRVMRSSSATLTGTIVSNDNGRDGIFVFDGASVTDSAAANITTNNNARAGIGIIRQSLFDVNDNGTTLIAQNNRANGASVSSGASFNLGAGTSLTVNGTGTQGSFSAGLNVIQDSHFIMQAGATLVVQDNTGVGLAAERTASMSLRGTMTVQRNALDGLQMLRNAQVLLAGFAGAFEAHIDNNGGSGVRLGEASTLTITGGGTLTIQNNTGPGIAVREASSLFVSNVTATIQNNTGQGITADDSSVSLSNATISGNRGSSDVALSFGTRASLNGNTIGTITCDDTVLSRGSTLCPL